MVCFRKGFLDIHKIKYYFLKKLNKRHEKIIEEMKKIPYNNSQKTYESFPSFPSLPIITEKEVERCLNKITPGKALAFDGVSYVYIKTKS